MTQQEHQIEVGDLVRYDNPNKALLKVWDERKYQDAIVTKAPDPAEGDQGWYSLTTIGESVFDYGATWSARGKWLRIVAKATYERLD